ncbi:hypothetical protein G7Z17_g12328 [Cylindrodendrum hubeiense]|uniref:Clr5 domain-containing protein n=1 Tax=Cylindrodendrum hubeiense TaxID=595255 RepID=A0A9P5L376_9HYPO|nr:hypothetical protein G7Z17_g12328 [Cylindrodendrum hubeiense]
MMAKPWSDHRHTIVRLYINEGRTLEDVRAIMKTQYGFEASVRSYRQHFDQWRVGKYNCKKRQQRRRESLASRPLLPSPPRTPVVGASSAMDSVSERGTVGAPSPESVISTRRSSQHTPEQQRPLPDPPRPVPKHHARAKCMSAMGPPSSVWGEEELQVVLRNGMVEEGMLPLVNPTSSPPSAQRARPADKPSSTLALDSRGVELGKLPKYLHPGNCPTTTWDMPRPTTTPTFQLGSPDAEYYRLPYHDTVPRCLPDNLFTLSSLTRPAEYRPALRSPPVSVPRLMQG